MSSSVPSWLAGTALPWLHEEASVFGQGPLIIADVAQAASLESCGAELGAAIVIGVDEQGKAPEASDIFDVVLTTASSPPRPWVQVQSIANALESLSAAVKANPHAAVTLAQVLRAQRTVSFDAALLIESFAFSSLLGGSEFRRWHAGASREPPALEVGPAVLVERDGDTLRISLARPGNDNALTAELRDQLVEALREARLDDSIETVEIMGLGRFFCQGGALHEFGMAEDLALAHQIRTVRSVAWAMHNLKARTRVKIQGGAVGSGLEFAAVAQEIVAGSSTFFSLPEVSMGLIPGAGGTVTVAKRIGRQRTCYMALSGAQVRARTALAWGLIDRIDDA
jgi:hypothetical protein